MKLILIGCEYAGTTTLAIAFHDYAREHLGIELGSIHDTGRSVHGDPPSRPDHRGGGRSVLGADHQAEGSVAAAQPSTTTPSPSRARRRIRSSSASTSRTRSMPISTTITAGPRRGRRPGAALGKDRGAGHHPGARGGAGARQGASRGDSAADARAAACAAGGAGRPTSSWCWTASPPRSRHPRSPTNRSWIPATRRSPTRYAPWPQALEPFLTDRDRARRAALASRSDELHRAGRDPAGSGQTLQGSPAQAEPPPLRADAILLRAAVALAGAAHPVQVRADLRRADRLQGLQRHPRASWAARGTTSPTSGGSPPIRSFCGWCGTPSG